MTHLLVLAGTGEARQLLAQLATNPNIRITASLAGATDRPAAFGVETRIGGFGGVEGLAEIHLHHVFRHGGKQVLEPLALEGFHRRVERAGHLLALLPHLLEEFREIIGHR